MYVCLTCDQKNWSKLISKGIPQEIIESEVKEGLESLKYKVEKVTGMKGRNGPLPMILINNGKEYKSIFNIKRCCGLVIQVELLNRRKGVIQYHRCQMLGYIPKSCNSIYKYMKCGNEHLNHECKELSTASPKCTNC